MDNFLLDPGAGFVAGHMKMGDQEDHLNELAELLKRFKTQYEKTVPDLFSWYRDGEIRF